MAIIKTVSVTYERKINLGDFNSAHIGLTVWADIESGDDVDATMRALWEMTTANVKAKAAEFYPKLQAQSQELFLGLPIKSEEDNNGN